MHDLGAMSWQFNHLISPQTSATTSSSLTSLTDHISKNDAGATTTDRMASLLGDQYRFQAADTAALPVSSQQQRQAITDNTFFQKLLQQRDLGAGSGNPHRNIVASSSFNNITTIAAGEPPSGNQKSKNISDGSSASITNAATSILSSSRSSIIDHLIPDRQPALPWSTYSIPIYSSFGADMKYSNDGEGCSTPKMSNVDASNSGPSNASINTSNNSNNINNNNNNNISNATNIDDSSKLLSVGSNLIDRFNNNQSSSDNNVIFSNTGSSSSGALGAVDGGNPGRTRIGPHNRQQNDPLGSARTYSNVLHKSSEIPEMHGRLSMFATVQPPSQSDPVLDPQSSLIPTNQNYRQFSSHQHHYDQQQQTQLHHSSDFISPSTGNQQFYPSAPCQTINTANTFAASITANQPAQAENGAIGSGYFLRSNYTDKSVVGSGGGIGASTSGGPGKRRNKLPFLNNSFPAGTDGYRSLKVDMYGSALVNSDGSERFSRKVFVGGLPPDIDEEEIKASFRRFGSLIVDWPHKAESKSYFPPKGYAFLLFHEESSVQALIDACLHEDDKLYLCVSSPTIKDKPVQIRPWRLIDADFVLDSTLALDPRKTVFVGGVPRPLKASELANIMNNLYGGVCYAGIDTDPELKYPKGAGRVAFSNHQSYIAAISARFVHLHHSEIEKRVEVKPYVLDDQFCDECQGARCGSKFAPFFCANINCLQYYCENCWSTIHSQPGREFHKPLVKEGADRPRGIPFRWC